MYLAQSTNWGHFPDRNGIYHIFKLFDRLETDYLVATLEIFL